MRPGNVLLITGLFLNSLHLSAQQLPFVHYTPKDGLVNSRVRSAYQDNRGRMYFATYSGLSVYDGSRFTNYTTENGLAANAINQVIAMGDDSLWVIPNANKIHCLVGGTMKDFITSDKFYPVINQLIKCSDGYYYALADDGLYRFENNRFVRLTLKDKTGREINMYFVRGAEINNQLFLVTDATVPSFPAPSYLVVFDTRTRKAFIGKKPPGINYITRSPKNEILVATDKGLKTLDPAALAKEEIRFIPPPSLYKPLEKASFYHLYFDREENLWALNEHGILKLSRQGQIKSFTTENGLSVNFYSSVYQDRENIMWFLNLQTGMSKLANQAYEVQAFIKPGFVAGDLYADSKSDSVWFIDGIHNKILLQHPKGSREFHINLPPGFFRMTSSGKTSYFGGGDGVYRADIPYNTNKLQVKFLYPGYDTAAKILGAGCLMPDNNGNLVFSNASINAVIQDSTVSYPLGYGVDQFSITPDNHLWVVTREKKLFLFQLNARDPLNYFKLIKQYSQELPPIAPRSLAVDKEGTVWIGSRDHGLFRFYFDRNFNLTSQQQFTTKNGLSDNFISYLHCDPGGNIWACSPVGLDKLQTKNKTVFIENITRANNMYQNVIKIGTSKNDTKWILSSAGIIKIEPSTNPLKTYLAKIFFTGIETGNKSILGLGVDHAFSYKENDIRFHVAAPSFIDEKQTRFSYRLRGRDNEEWSDPSDNTDFRFISLAPGSYSLDVKASFINGAYPDTEASYSFEILPPWWQTWWFRILWVIGSATAAALLVRIYFRRKLNKQRILLENQQAIEKERSRIASDMHDELGAGLSTIRFLSENVKRNSFGAVTRQDADKIVMNSNDLIQKMNEIIWAMNEKNDTLEDLLFYTRSYAMKYCEENNLECTVHIPEPVPGLLVSGEIRRNIFLTIKESLHNIVKHAKASKVVIQFEIQDHLYIRISDNGKGIDTITKISGGNGLLNMKKRIKLLDGSIEFNNGAGLTVEFRIPLKVLS